MPLYWTVNSRSSGYIGAGYIGRISKVRGCVSCATSCPSLRKRPWATIGICHKHKNGCLYRKCCSLMRIPSFPPSPLHRQHVWSTMLTNRGTAQSLVRLRHGTDARLWLVTKCSDCREQAVTFNWLLIESREHEFPSKTLLTQHAAVKKKTLARSGC